MFFESLACSTGGMNTKQIEPNEGRRQEKVLVPQAQCGEATGVPFYFKVQVKCLCRKIVDCWGFFLS